MIAEIDQEKESLITELRRELRISNEDHRELLGRVNADGVIQRIRSDTVVNQPHPRQELGNLFVRLPCSLAIFVL